jgi:hypothetical protein
VVTSDRFRELIENVWEGPRMHESPLAHDTLSQRFITARNPSLVLR